MRLFVFTMAIIALYLYSNAYCQCHNCYFNYKSFVIRQTQYDLGKKLIHNGQYKDAIILYRKLLNDPNFKLAGRTKIAVCYYLLHQEGKAMDEIDKAILEGHPIEYIKSQEELAPIFPKIEKHYNILRPKYLIKIDTALRSELVKMVYNDQGIRYELHKPENYTKKKKDSIYAIMKYIDSVNLIKLNTIITKHGWPNPKIIGTNATIYDPHRELYLDLFAIHNGERVNIKLLQLALKDVCKGEENWFAVITMMKNLLWRYNHDGYNKLRYTYLTNEGMIDWEKSYFQLKVLSELMHDNPHDRISLFITRYNSETLERPEGYIKTLDEIRKFLISERINPNQIFIEDEIRAVEDDGLGKYRIAYKLY